MTDRFNTIAGWTLFAGIVALGLSSISSRIFHADSHEAPEVAGFPIQGVEIVEGATGPDLGTLLAAADPAAGEKVFAKCVSCHTADQGGAHGIGPNVYAIIGKPIGKHAAGFAYSSALADHGGDWNYENLDKWLASPAGFAPGTKMSFAGLSKPEDRANVIAFLKSKGGGPEYPAPAAPAAAEGAEGETPAGGVEGGALDPVDAAGAMGDEQPVADQGAAVGNTSQ
ncbi:MAG: c-type cytochrome [Croceibacterium sp.]